MDLLGVLSGERKDMRLNIAVRVSLFELMAQFFS